MEQSAWTGLGLGAAIGGLYAWFQLRSLQRADQAGGDGKGPHLAGHVPGAIGRLGFLMLVLVLLVTVPGDKIDKGWLTGSLAIFYGVPLIWRLKRMFAAKQ